MYIQVIHTVCTLYSVIFGRGKPWQIWWITGDSPNFTIQNSTIPVTQIKKDSKQKLTKVLLYRTFILYSIMTITNCLFLYMVQLRCNFTLTREQFTCTHIELLMTCALLPTRNSSKIIRWSLGVVFDIVTHVSFQYHVIDHHNVHRLVLRLVSRSRNLCHRALIH